MSNPILEERHSRPDDATNKELQLYQKYCEIMVLNADQTKDSQERKAARDQFCDGVKGLFQARGGAK
jgi:hypothetical protein